jgi:hypothetical protein
MLELLVFLAWMGIGVTVQVVRADRDRHVAWLAAGALLGPLWWFVLADRQTLARSVIEP